MPIAPYYQHDVANPHDGITRGRIVEDLQSTEPRSNDYSFGMNFSAEKLAAVKFDFDLKDFLDNIRKGST